MRLRRFYHFTSEHHLSLIEASGVLSKGDVPLTLTGGVNAVWLTSNNDWTVLGWTEQSAHDKTAVRIAVDLPLDEVTYWPTYAANHQVDKQLYWTLDDAGSNQSANWYLHFNPIPVPAFAEVVRKPALPEVIQLGLRKCVEEDDLTRLVELAYNNGLVMHLKGHVITQFEGKHEHVKVTAGPLTQKHRIRNLYRYITIQKSGLSEVDHVL